MKVDSTRLDYFELWEIAVIIPCYNEAVTIAQVVKDFKAVLPKATLYVYDNNSSDETITQAMAAGAIVRSERWQGKGNVVRRMFADIDADFYILIDGDGTYDVSFAADLLRYCLLHQVDMVNAARSGRGQHVRPGHQFGNLLLNLFVQFLFDKQFVDMLSGYRVFTRRFVKSFPVVASGFEIETELTIHAIEMKMPVAEVFVPFRNRPEGSQSKLNTIRDGFRILRLILRLLREERPLQFFGGISMLLLIAAIVLVMPVIYEYFLTGLVPRFPTFILATVLAVLSCLCFFSGLILDTVTRCRKELKRLKYLSIEAPWVKVKNLESVLQSIGEPKLLAQAHLGNAYTMDKAESRQRRLFRFLKFAIVGSVGFGTDLMMFKLFLTVTSLNLYICRVLAFPVAVFSTWLLNRRLTFGDRQKRRNRSVEYFSYLGTNLIGISVNFSTFAFCLRFLPVLKENLIIPMFLGTLSGLVFNYYLSNNFVFRSSKKSSTS